MGIITDDWMFFVDFIRIYLDGVIAEAIFIDPKGKFFDLKFILLTLACGI